MNDAELPQKCGAWKAETGLCTLRSEHDGRHLDTIHNKSWMVGNSDVAGKDGRL